MGAVVGFLLSRMKLWLVAAIAYFCGCFNGAVIVSKYILRDDVRNHGSGNAGLTNFYRTFGGALTFVVILTDVLKAVVAILVAKQLFFAGYTIYISAAQTEEHWRLFAEYWAALWCLLGHMFPCMFQFKGGKGILSGGTLVWLLDWRVGLIAWGLFAALWLLTRYVSLGSVCAAASMPVTTFFFCGQSILYTVLAVLIAALVIWCHRENITRLLHHQERKFQWHTGTPKEKE